MASKIEVTVEPEESTENIKYRYGAYGSTGKIEASKNNNFLSEEEREKVRNAPSKVVGNRRDIFVDWLVEEVFEGGYQTINNILLTRIKTFDGDADSMEELIEFLEEHEGKRAFIRSI